MSISAVYFDGKTSRMHLVNFTVQGEELVMQGQEGAGLARRCHLEDLRVSERSYNAPRKVSFSDGAYLEVDDHEAINNLLHETGYRDSFVVRMQQSWRATLLALVLTCAVLALTYFYGIPAAANALARVVPASVERSIGDGVLAFWDGRLLAPSMLPTERQELIVAKFHALRVPGDSVVDHKIVFRKSKIGPNAFALPSGEIVLTDEIVNLLNDDQAVLGVLAHELGHLQHHHMMRRLIQTSSVAAVMTVLFGDVSAIAVNIPTVMADLKYSRDTEREADDYAIALLKANGIALSHLSHVFEALANEALAKKSGAPSPYLSSHPSGEERVARINQAQ